MNKLDWESKAYYLRRLIASTRDTIANDERTLEGIEAFGPDVTSGYWLDISLLCNVVEDLLNEHELGKDNE